MSEITIATSIFPRDFSLQRAAIDSWRNLGFKVVSLNSATEALIIKREFPDISVMVVARTAEPLVGKPCVFFDDIRAALIEDDANVCGIVNSDIFLFANAGFAEFIVNVLKDVGFLFGSRIDIESPNDVDGTQFIYGFDYFFFSREQLNVYPTSDFCLGVPWWDYWAPIVPLLKGNKCVELISPIAYHIKHETKWSSKLYIEFGQQFAQKYVQLCRDLELVPVNVLPDTPAAMTMFSIDVLSLILNKSEKIVYPVKSGNNMLIEVGCTQYLAMREQVLDYHKKCIEIQEQCNRLELSVEQSQLQDVYSSLSWRITKPLRWLGDRVRKL